MIISTRLLLAAALVGAGDVLADTYKQASVIPWSPKNTTSVDQSTVYNGTYYLSDRVNYGVHVVDLASNKQTGLVSGFVGLFTANGANEYNISGPNGLLVLPDRNELYVGDGDGTVRVIDLFTKSVTANISVGISSRADEMAYDASTGTVVVTLPNEIPPQIAVISAAERKMTGKVTFHNASSLEQPVFDSVSGQFYVSVPSTGANPGGEIAGFDVSTLNVTRTLPLSQCIPAGIVFGDSQNLFISCSADQIKTYGVAYSQVMDVGTGNIVANISGVAGVDQVAYDSNAKLFFASAYQNTAGGKASGAAMPQLAVINAISNTLMQTWSTDSTLAHSVAVDTVTNQVVVPLKDSGIVVYNLTASTSASATATSASAVPTQSANAAGHYVVSGGVLLGALAVTASLF